MTYRASEVSLQERTEAQVHCISRPPLRVQVKHTVDAEVQSLTGDGKAKRAAPNTTPQRPRARKGKPSALEAAITAMQRDSITFCDDPDDTEGYAEYCKAFDLAAKQFDIDELLSDNAFMAELHASLVPVVVSNEDFWQRYFFRCAVLFRAPDRTAANNTHIVGLPKFKQSAMSMVGAPAPDDMSRALM